MRHQSGEDLSGENQHLVFLELANPSLLVPVINAQLAIVLADGQIRVSTNVFALLVYESN